MEQAVSMDMPMPCMLIVLFSLMLLVVAISTAKVQLYSHPPFALFPKLSINKTKVGIRQRYWPLVYLISLAILAASYIV